MPPTCQQTLKVLTEEKDALTGGHRRICLRLGRDGTQHRISGKTLRISIIRQRRFALINGILSDPGACRPMVEHDLESAAGVAESGTEVDTTSWALEDKIVFTCSLHP